MGRLGGWRHGVLVSLHDGMMHNREEDTLRGRGIDRRSEISIVQGDGQM